jgi:cobalt-zinc-cadmium efflux system outer membrane protein
MKRLLTIFGLSLSILVLIPWSALANSEGSIELTKEQAGPITLQKAIAKALVGNPELDVFSLEQRAREARALQSGFFPNPQVQVTVEDAAGSGKFSGFSQSQTTIQLSQLVELGGKRSARLRSSNLSGRLAAWDYETKRMDVLTQVSKAYIEVLKAQQQVRLEEDRVSLGEKFLSAVAERVKAGKVAALEKVKAEVTLSSMQVQLEKARRELNVARRNLSATWGSTEPLFESALGDLFSISPVPSLKQLQVHLANNPDLERWTTELEQRQAVLDRELSKRIPDLKLSGGFRRIEETDDSALVFGVSIPLQLFNRNQGRIAEARHRLAKAGAEKRAKEIKVTTIFLAAYNQVDFTHSQVIAIQTKILPGAQQAFDGINEGYRFGKFGYLDVLDSQKTLFAAKGQYLEALADYHKAVADVERLTGNPLASTHPPLEKPEGEQRP